MKAPKAKFIGFAITILALSLVLFRKQIFENPISKAKLRIFQSIMTDSPDTAWQKTQEIVDSTLIRLELKK